MNDDEEGWVGTFLIEPLTALAGGLLGGALALTVAWHLTWRARTPPKEKP